MNLRFLSLALCGTLHLVSCKQEPKIAYSDGLSGVWGEMMAPYGIYPLFPVRTNVQPGDIYILCKRPNPPSSDQTSSSGAATIVGPVSAAWTDGKGEWVHLFSLKDIDKVMDAYAKTRMAFGSTTVAAAPVAAAPMGPASSASSPYTVDRTGNTIGFASFPSVMSYTQNRSDFGVGTVVGTTAIGLGTSSVAQGFYTLEIPSAEYAYLPHEALQSALAATVASTPDSVKSILLGTQIALKNKDCVDGSLSVVGAVYYTRHITTSMGDSYAAALSARAAYALPSGSTRDSVFIAIGSYATGASAPAGPASSSFPSEAARFAQLIIDLDKLYKTADDNSKLGFAGVKVGFAKAGGKGISMDYSYAVPVAFGVRLYAIGLLESEADVTLDPVISIRASRPRTLTPSEDTPMKGKKIQQRPAASDPDPDPAASSPK